MLSAPAGVKVLRSAISELISHRHELILQLGLFLLTSFFVYLVQALYTTVENFKCPSSEVWQGEYQL